MTCTQHIAAAALLATLSTSANSAIFDRDDRQYVSATTGSPYAPVGLVTYGGLMRTYTTGFLVDDCHVLSSQVVLGFGQAPREKRAKFETGIGTPDHQSTRGTVVAAGGMNRHDTIQDRYEGGPRGWLLLRLDKCIGVTIGHVKLRTGPFSPDEFRNLQSVGYPVRRSRKKGLTIDPACSVYYGKGAIWFNDCATVRADGGDPIFRISTNEGKPEMEVYAIQLYGFKAKRPITRVPGRENQAVSMAELAPQIERYLSVRTGASGRGPAAESQASDALSHVSAGSSAPSNGHLLDTRVVSADDGSHSDSRAQ